MDAIYNKDIHRNQGVKKGSGCPSIHPLRCFFTMDIKGWFPIERGIFEQMLAKCRPNCLREVAIMDLCYMAAYREREFYIRGNKVSVKQGQVAISEAELAKRWGWSRGKVQRFIQEEVNEHKIERTTIQQTGQQTGQQTDIKIGQQKRAVVQILTINYEGVIGQQTGQQTEKKQKEIETKTDQQTGQPINKEQYTKETRTESSTEGVGENSADCLKEMLKELMEQNKMLTEQIAELTKPKQRQKKEPSPINAKAREIFVNKYKELCGEDYYWKAKDAGCMSTLLKQIKFSRKSKGMDISDQGIIEGLAAFLDHIKDSFILNHFEVSMLISQYNSIVSAAKGKNDALPSMEIGRIITEYDENKFKNKKTFFT